MNILDMLLNMMLHFTPFGAILCAILLFLRRKEGDRARVMLIISFTTCGTMMLGSVIYHYYDTRKITDEVFSMISLNISMFLIFIMNLYPISIINSGKQSIRNLILLFSPYLLINLALLIFQPEFRKLYSLEDIFQHLGEYNIWLRMAFLLYMIISTIYVFFLPYIHTRSRVNLRWIHGYCLGMIGVLFFYFIWSFTGTSISYFVLQFYFLCFCLTMTYHELFIRLQFPIDNQIPSIIPSKEETTQAEPLTASPLQGTMLRLLDEQKVWRDPDLTIAELSSLLCTNRTTLSKTIKEAGYDSFYEMVNTYRIKEFIYIIEHQKIKGIHETFFDVGFRSKATAIRNFRQQTGTTPSEYLQQILLDKE